MSIFIREGLHISFFDTALICFWYQVNISY